ncbi:MAG: transglutaminase [Salinarimonadaceae bacterium]|nr:MAG: transglutaminase [Salinarimonadaceae bacterium]
MRDALSKKILVGLAVAVGAFAAFSAIDPATASRSPALQAPTFDTGTARPIQGWIDFCRRYPSECIVNLDEPEIVTLDRLTWNTILSVNREVNAEITPMTDMELYGVADYWDFPHSGAGDCEDIQLLKRKRLADAGLPRRAMRMTVVIDELNEGHAVLMIRTDRGDFILDNKTDEVLAWHETPYVYVSRESQHGSSWTSLGHAAGPLATANR